MNQSLTNMELTKRGLETVRGSKVSRDLVKNAFGAIQLPCPVSVRHRTPVIVGEEALLSSQ
jgi:predicted transporter